MIFFKCVSAFFLFILYSCSDNVYMLPDVEKESQLATTQFRTFVDSDFADIYEDESLKNHKVLISEFFYQVRYIIYNSAGNLVKEKNMSTSELENGFKVDLPSGKYRISVLGEGRIENYTPTGTITDEIKGQAHYKSVWVSSNQRARKPVYRDYFFGELEFVSGFSEMNSIALKRATGVLQVEITGKADDILIHEISIGTLQNEMYNHLHTDGSYSFSDQPVSMPSEPYATLHSLNYMSEQDYYTGVYFPTVSSQTTCDFLICYERGRKIYTRRIRVPDFVIERNKRTKVSITIS